MVDAPEAVLVIARGDPRRGDEGAAWQILEGLRRLRPRPGLPPLHLRHTRQWEPELAEALSRASGVVFLDALRDGVPGEVHCRPVSPAAGLDPLADSLSPQGLLLYAETFFGRAPQGLLIGIVGQRFESDQPLSSAVSRAVSRAVAAVLRHARAWTRTEGVAAGDEKAHASSSGSSESD